MDPQHNRQQLVRVRSVESCHWSGDIQKEAIFVANNRVAVQVLHALGLLVVDVWMCGCVRGMSAFATNKQTSILRRGGQTLPRGDDRGGGGVRAHTDAEEAATETTVLIDD